MFFILVIFLLSWYHWSDTTWLHNLRKKYGRITETLQSKASKAIESKSGFRDDEDLSFLDDKSTDSEIDEIGGSSDSRGSSKEELLGSKPRRSNEEQQLHHRRMQEAF